MALVLMLSLTTMVFATSTVSPKTVIVTFNAYATDDFDFVDIPVTVSVSNVTSQSIQDYSVGLSDGEKTITFAGEESNVLTCQAPVTITLLPNSGMEYVDVCDFYIVADISTYKSVIRTDKYYAFDTEDYVFDYSEKLTTKPSGSYSLADGCTQTLTKAGTYVLYTRPLTGLDDSEFGLTPVFIVVGDDSTIAPPTPEVSTVKAIPTPSKVYVNGKLTEFEAYGINGNNYFKLRDLAKVIDGTAKNFEVTWDGEKKSINLVSNKGYTEVGGELAKGDGKEKTATLNTSIIYKDGEIVQLAAYTIGQNNYFKLRDVAQAFNIGVTWDGETSTIGIDTAIDYVP